MESVILSNGKKIYCVNPREVDFLYDEIFLSDTYFRHGVCLSTGSPVVLDIGANIGMFTLNILEKNPNARVIAIEPIPPTFCALVANTKEFSNVDVINMGISDEVGIVEFCYFPTMSTDSVQKKYRDNHETDLELSMDSFYKDRIEDKEKRKRLVRHLMSPKMLKEEHFMCEMTTISKLIQEKNISQIDLLKIDVEKSEFEALQGISDEHWTMIKQVVMEVHRLGKEELDRLRKIFTDHNFKVYIDYYEKLDIPQYFNVYAIRRGDAE